MTQTPVTFSLTAASRPSDVLPRATRLSPTCAPSFFATPRLSKIPFSPLTKCRPSRKATAG
jgi:hypothetical protein